jgi:membrane protease YdiL (CAAX protease family)
VKPANAQIVAVLLKVGVFVFLSAAGLFLFANVLMLFGYVVAATLSNFAAAAVANALAMRIWERGHLIGIGFMWNASGVRNLLLGLAGGMGSALIVILGPVVEGAAHFEKVPGAGDWSNALLLMTLLVFGAIGEEMMFHGYAFQVLMGLLGPFATILPVSVVFGLAHGMNMNVTPFAMVNTGLWGLVLGFAFWRSGDLWLPIGLHLGWNWILPLFGANLSGFTMSVTGYVMRWQPGMEKLSGGAYGPEGSPLTTGILVVLFGWLMWKAPVRRQTPWLLREQWDEIGGPEEPAKE